MKVLYKVIIVLYLIVGIIPTLKSIDKVITQWLFLNCLNTISFVLLVVKGYPLKKFFFDRTTILFFCLFIWSLVSLFFAINPIESIVVLSQIFAIVMGFLIISICISEIENSFQFISNIISFFLIIELCYIYSPFFIVENAQSQIFSRSVLFLGFAANVNITAFSVLYKIPFLVYSLIQLNKYKILSYIIAFVIFSLIVFTSGTLNSTRGAILAYTLLMPILVTIGSVVYTKTKDHKLLAFGIIYCLSVIFTFQINSHLSKTLQDSSVNISRRISSLNALIDKEEKIDESLNQRINFYSQALKVIIENPVFGIGIGNWKIKSIDTNKENIVGYTVPYHTHNDYLEIGAEIGLVGLLIYISILFRSFKFSTLKFLKIIFTRNNLKRGYLKWICISIFLFIFILDSNFNFPFHRPILLINLIVLLAYLNQKQKIILNEKS